ncbi:MAG: thermonuclease family protein [Desulfurococcales archaeon]|nr:thermonuclease family protein [Desulfurococcales archaeon]
MRVSALCVSLIVVLLVLGVASPLSSSPGVEIDVIAVVKRVVDGDTFDAFPVGRVRLADIDAPELGTAEGDASRIALERLILGKTVYLDVDDLYVIDRYNRVVAIAYIRYNDTHLLNVNKWLVDNGYARVVDYPNEFKPSAWTLYIYFPKEYEAKQPTTITITTTQARTIVTTQTVTQTITKAYTDTRATTLTTTLTDVRIATLTILKTDVRTHLMEITREITRTTTIAGIGIDGTLIIAAIAVISTIILLPWILKRLIHK